MRLLVRHAHVNEFTQRWRCGTHLEKNWHHWHKMSTRVTHTVCSALTPRSRNLLRSASLQCGDKTHRRQQTVACPIRGALHPDPDLLRNSHSSTPQVSLSRSLYSSNMCTHKHTQTQSNRADSVCISWHELTNQFEQCWRGWKGHVVSRNAFILLMSTDQGA